MWHITPISVALSMSQPEKFEPAYKSLREPAESLPELRETDLERVGAIKPGEEFVVGRYRLDRQIGEGGMSVVYKAYDITLSRDVAVKRLHTTKLGGALARFQQEARAAAKLQSKHIVSIFDFGTENDGTPYLVMEYIDGVPLSDLIKPDLDWKTACNIISQVCDALNQAHNAGVVHRDIKPSNILVTSNQSGSYFARVVDFGIARLEESAQSLTQTGEVFGSPLYMSPEQATGKRVDARTDIYSLGCVLFETLTGHPPFEGASSLETLMMHQSEPTPKIHSRNIPGNLMTLVESMLEKDPNLRPSSCASILDRLDNIVANPTSREAPSSRSVVKTKKSNNAKLIGGALLAAVSLGAVTLAFMMPPHAISPEVNQEKVAQTKPVKNSRLPDAEITNLLTSVKEKLHQSDVSGAFASCRKALARSKDFGTALQRAECLQLYASLLTNSEVAVDPSARKEAEVAARESTKIAEDEGMNTGPYYIYQLMTLANVLNLSEQQREAIQLANRCLILVDQTENSNGYQAGEIHHSLGKYYADFQNFGAAKEQYAKALKIFASIKNSEKDQALIHTQQGQLFVVQNRATDALSEYQKAIDLYKYLANSNADGYKLLANAYLDEARFFNSKLALDLPKDPKVSLREKAKEAARDALKASVNPLQRYSSLRLLGKFAYQNSDFEGAEDYYQQAFEECDKLPKVLVDARKEDMLKAMAKIYKDWGQEDKLKKVRFRLENLTKNGAYN